MIPPASDESVLDQMINEELVRQEAAKRGITASKSEVDAAIQALIVFIRTAHPLRRLHRPQ